MKVYKFGGASVKDTEGIRNLEAIVRNETGHLVIVVSAFGKTTNALEQVLKAWMAGNDGYSELLDNLYAITIRLLRAFPGREFGKGHDRQLFCPAERIS
jgi:aspartokinase